MGGWTNIRTDLLTNLPTDRQMDIWSHPLRDARTHLKINEVVYFTMGIVFVTSIVVIVIIVVVVVVPTSTCFLNGA